MKSILFCCLLAAFTLPAQVIDLDDGTTRAVVIGISDYQSAAIPDLRFADKDAEAFAAWLRSPAGGSLPAENIQLLTNGKATQGQIVAAFGWLTAETKPSDLAILYFSGHGDVEVKSAAQLGFLLCHDAPSALYKAGGAYSLFFLQDDISAISANGGKVVLALDACHAGKLAGNEVGGTSATASALTRQFANEVKIMSCQPSELSLEGEQWGGGRGVFSFHLVEGLTGLADKNTDGSVNLLEIGRYLEEIVPAETAPLSQIPTIYGEKNTLLAKVEPLSLAALKQEKQDRQLSIKKIASKGTDLAGLDSATMQLYKNFQAALDSGNLITSTEGGKSAWDFFQSLSQNVEVKSLRELMRRNLAAALQDEVQQAMNALLEADPAEVNQWRANPVKYVQYPAYLERAIALLGEKHYMFKPLMAKKLYFEAYNLNRSIDQMQDLVYRDSVKAIAKQKLLEALTYDPDAAYIFHAIGYLYFVHNPYRTDSMSAYINRAIGLAPSWALPYADMSGELLWSAADFEGSEQFLKKLLALKPNSYVALERYAITCLWLNRVEEAKSICQRLIEMRPDVSTGYQIMTWASLQKQDYEAAEQFVEKCIEVEGKSFSESYAGFGAGAYVDLCRVLNRTARYGEGMAMLDSALTYLSPSDFGLMHEKAIACLEHGDYSCAKAMADALLTQIEHPGIIAQTNCVAGKVAFHMDDLAAAEKHLAAGIEADPTPNDHDPWLFAYMGLVKEKQGKLEEARRWFGQAEAYHYWLSVFPVKIDSKFLFGEFLLRQRQPEQALEKFNFILGNCPNDYRGWYGMALYHAFRKENDLVLDNLEKALDRYFPIPKPILEEPLFKKIRKTKRFRAIMAKHFPDSFSK